MTNKKQEAYIELMKDILDKLEYSLEDSEDELNKLKNFKEQILKKLLNDQEINENYTDIEHLNYNLTNEDIQSYINEKLDELKELKALKDHYKEKNSIIDFFAEKLFNDIQFNDNPNLFDEFVNEKIEKLNIQWKDQYFELKKQYENLRQIDAVCQTNHKLELKKILSVLPEKYSIRHSSLVNIDNISKQIDDIVSDLESSELYNEELEDTINNKKSTINYMQTQLKESKERLTFIINSLYEGHHMKRNVTLTSKEDLEKIINSYKEAYQRYKDDAVNPNALENCNTIKSKTQQDYIFNIVQQSVLKEEEDNND